jgi:hypothetical protein
MDEQKITALWTVTGPGMLLIATRQLAGRSGPGSRAVT